ncbi:MAG TPA: 4'-phosphopantetheinyl transferase superfamily protein [Anaerolineales bacterium]|nr:4'-phosphopantetheinyl transferase superfamily protein [Anaerolineales bacterium]
MSESTWSLHPEDWDVQLHQVDIWRIHLNLSIDPVKPHESVLSAEETQRAAGFHFPRDRNRFILAHRAMREILAQYLNCRPEQLDFSTNEYGKPSLSDRNLQFNLSHSGTFALLAVSPLHKVGIDVEQARLEVEIESLGRRFFSQSEYSELMVVPREQRVAAFYRYWTLKEAYIKAQGLGLSLPLDSFDVSLTSKKSVNLKATRPDPNEAYRWTLLSLEVDPDYAGAVAVENNSPEFRHWDWNSLAAE